MPNRPTPLRHRSLLGDVAQIRTIDRQLRDDLRATAAELVEHLWTAVVVSLLEDSVRRSLRFHVRPARAVDNVHERGYLAAIGERIHPRGSDRGVRLRL